MAIKYLNYFFILFFSLKSKTKRKIIGNLFLLFNLFKNKYKSLRISSFFFFINIGLILHDNKIFLFEK